MRYKFIRRYSLVLIMSCVFLVVCGDASETIPESTWVEDVEFTYADKNQYNSHASKEAAYFLGRNTITEISYPGGQEERISSLLAPSDNNFKMPMNDYIFVGAGTSQIHFIPIRNPVENEASSQLRMEDYDPNFLRFDFPSLPRGPAVVLDKLNRAVVPYIASSNPNDELSIVNKVMLVQLGVSSDQGSSRRDSLLIENVKVISLTDPKNPGLTNHVFSLHVFNDVFYVTTQNQTLYIDPDGEYQNLQDTLPLRRMFSVGTTLFGLNFETLYISANGLEWSEVTTNIEAPLRLLDYVQTNGWSLAFYRSQIFGLELIDSRLSVTELDNQGLEGHQVTSISFFEGQVFVTTLSGVFRKPLQLFGVTKPEKVVQSPNLFLKKLE